MGPFVGYFGHQKANDLFQMGVSKIQGVEDPYDYSPFLGIDALISIVVREGILHL